MRGDENHQCPVYEHVQDVLPDGTIGGLIRGIGSRADAEYARNLIGLEPQPLDEHYWSPDGWCTTPRVDLYVRSIRNVPPLNDTFSSPSNLSCHPVARVSSKT